MASIAIVYATTEGQTAKIAAHIADVGRKLGHSVSTLHAPELGPDCTLSGYEAAILGASVHEGHYQRALGEFARQHRVWLSCHPSAFFSVSLGAASKNAEERADVEKIAADFCASCEWTPAATASFAGALKYTQYSWLKRALMKHISKREGGSTDTRTDHEYTDWDAVDAFAHAFFGRFAAAT